MPRYLRCIEQRLDSDEIYVRRLFEAVTPAHVRYLGWMYETYATPLRSDGVGKVNVIFTMSTEVRPPQEVLNIASVYERVDPALLAGLSEREQQHYWLEALHRGVMRCATEFGWHAQRAVDARARIIAEDFCFALEVGKPLSSPNHRLKTQPVMEISRQDKLHLVFFDNHMKELRRVVLKHRHLCPGDIELLKIIKWVDNETVKVSFSNERDYWLCSTDGRVEFHFPRGEAGDPHGEYALGLIHLAGELVPKNEERAIALMSSAAAKGYRHAQNFLRRRATEGEE